MRPRMSGRIWIGAALLAAAVLLVALRVGGAGEAAPAAETAAVRVLGPRDVEVAARGRVESGVAVSGSLEPYRQAEVRAQLAGTVREVLAERGEPVRRGQVLALYDPAAVRSQLAGAEAALAASRAAEEAAVREREAAVALHDAGAVAERDLRQARSAAAAARAAVRAAEARLVEAREAAQRSRVTAPLAGVVSRRGVSAGEAVVPGQPLFTIVDPDTLELAARVPAHEVSAARVGRPVVFTLDAYPGRRFEGFIARVDPVADPGTRQVTAYVHLPNTDGALVAGLHATGRILGEVAEAAVTVPAAAVRGEDDAPYVLTVAGGEIRRVAVALGPRDAAGDRVAVLRGLEAGATVVIGPDEGLEPGTPVRLPRDDGAAEVRP
jgi:membrane fusion protein, multidrug efflux system